MSAQLIELDLEMPEPAPVRRRGALLAAVIGAVVIAAVTLTVSHWQRRPKPVRLGSVVRATGLQTCADGPFVGLTFYRGQRRSETGHPDQRRRRRGRGDHGRRR